MQEWEKIMEERFGHDNLIALATAEDNRPYVRTVDAYYEGGSFYIITYARSNKIMQLEKNPCAAISGEWFTAHGTYDNMGFIGKAENLAMAEKLKEIFAAWIGNGDVDLSDENTIILRIKLTDGVLFYHGTRYDIDFSKEYA